MRQDGPEYSKGWRHSVVLDGVALRIEASHYSRPRMPRGSEIMKQMARGRPVAMVEETDYEWAVIAGGRRVCTLRQHPNGTFFSGSMNIPRAGLVEAAGIAAERMAPGLFVAGRPAAPDEEDAARKLGP